MVSLGKIDLENKQSYEPNSKNAIDFAVQEGLSVVFPEADEIQLDLDGEEAYSKYLQMRYYFDRFIGSKQAINVTSRGGKNRHITIKLNQPLPLVERILIAATLGSDSVREFLSYIQNRDGDPHPTLFLEKKIDLNSQREEMQKDDTDPAGRWAGEFRG